MRRVALVLACGVMAAACGDAGEAALPAAATDRTVQVATTAATPAAAAGGGASAGAPSSADAASSADAPSSADAASSPDAPSSADAASSPDAPSSADAPSGGSSASYRGVLRGDYKRLNGESEELARYRGRVVLVVNTATECGYTPQFEGLEALYRSRRGDGLVVLGFPANDFAGQEPRSDKEIATFCKANYGVSFPMFSKSRVVGDGANPLFRALTAAAGAPEWNFNKYLLDRRGQVVARYGAGTEPAAPELVERLRSLL
jgi:glutathione peroxidase